MGVTYLPGAPQYGQGGGSPQIDAMGISRLALAVKQFKMEKEQTERNNALQTLGLLTQNPGLLVATDPKEVEKLMGKIGIKLGGSEGGSLNPNPEQDGIPPLPTTLKPNQIAALGALTQGNKAGTQAATPPSKSAAAKAPGEGVTPTGNAQMVEHFSSQAVSAFNQKFGALAPLYASGMNQLEQEQIKAHTMNEIEQLKQAAAEGNPAAMGRLMMLAGKNVTDSDMRAMLFSAEGVDPKVMSQAMDFALGNETEAAKAQRFDSTLKTIMSTKSVMDKLQNPLDAGKIARSLVYSGSLPSDIQTKPLSVDELTNEATYEKQLTEDYGMPYSLSHTIARARSLGLDVSQALPKPILGMLSGPTLAERGVHAKEVTAEADMLKAQNEGLRLSAVLSEKKFDSLNARLKTMVEADKAGHAWPKDVRDGLINELASQTGLTPQEVDHWYSFATGRSWKYTPTPDADLARQAAGGGSAQPPSRPTPKVDKGMTDTLKELYRNLSDQGKQPQ